MIPHMCLVCLAIDKAAHLVTSSFKESYQPFVSILSFDRLHSILLQYKIFGFGSTIEATSRSSYDLSDDHTLCFTLIKPLRLPIALTGFSTSFWPRLFITIQLSEEDVYTV